MPGNNSILGGGGFHHVAIKVRDFDKTLRMYKETFGFTEKVAWGGKTDKGDGRAVMLDTGDGNYLEIFAGGQGATPPGATACGPVLIHWAIRTTRIDQTVERARAAGFQITVEPKDVSPLGATARIAFCQGPDGEVFELFQGELFPT